MKLDSLAPPVAAIVLLLLPLMYVGSYLLLVVPDGRSGTNTVYEDGKQGKVLYFSNYRFWTPLEPTI